MPLYALLSPGEQQRFESEIQIFLGEQRIYALGELDLPADKKPPLTDENRLLVAASAATLLLGRPEWRLILRLALTLGYASPRKMLDEMTPADLGDYLAEYTISPWGPERADLGTGIIASLLANIHRDTKKRSQPFTPADFMPYKEAQKSDEDQRREHVSKMKAIFSRLEITANRKRGK